MNVLKNNDSFVREKRKWIEVIGKTNTEEPPQKEEKETIKIRGNRHKPSPMEKHDIFLEYCGRNCWFIF